MPVPLSAQLYHAAVYNSWSWPPRGPRKESDGGKTAHNGHVPLYISYSAFWDFIFNHVYAKLGTLMKIWSFMLFNHAITSVARSSARNKPKMETLKFVDAK